MANPKEVVLTEGLHAISQQSSITIFIWCFGLIMMLLIYILKDKEKSNKARHKESEDTIKHLAEISSDLKEIVIANGVKTDNNTKRIDEVAKKVNDQ